MEVWIGQETEKINIQNMSEGECLEIVPYFTLNLFSNFRTNLPISIHIKKNEKPCYETLCLIFS